MLIEYFRLHQLRFYELSLFVGIMISLAKIWC